MGERSGQRIHPGIRAHEAVGEKKCYLAEIHARQKNGADAVNGEDPELASEAKLWDG
jgi:hypothetical protein